MTSTAQTVIQHTKNWIDEVVIGLNLCPFASRPFNEDRIDYIVAQSDQTEQHLQQLADCFTRLDKQSNIETILLILPQSYEVFDDYLELLHLSNLLLEELNYSGHYQLASFHPNYQFEASEVNDASNFTNRSPYPMLHLLREGSIEKAIRSYENIDEVPQNNIKKLRKIGFNDMQQTLTRILQEVI